MSYLSERNEGFSPVGRSKPTVSGGFKHRACELNPLILIQYLNK